MKREAILVLNAGSSSLKFVLFARQDAVLEPAIRGQVQGLRTSPRFTAHDRQGATLAEKSWGEGTALGHDGAVAHLAEFLRAQEQSFELAAVGHRVVHGGMEFARPVRIDRKILAVLDSLVPLAPLHQPHNLAPIRLLLERQPALPQVACFDTSFHATNPDLARRFALPEELYEAGVRRYGFHGLSYEYIASVLPRHDSRAATGRTVVCHLGNGSSLCALEDGRSIASTMGFTALDGLPMGTRSGSLDPGVLLYLMDERGMGARELEDLLYNRSGLLGVSGVSSDMRELLDSHDPRARLAVDLFVYRIRRELGSLAAALGGLDALVFTAGIGERSAVTRAAICERLAFLGVELDEEANGSAAPDAELTAPGGRVAVHVIAAREDVVIAREARRALWTPAAG